MRVLRALLKELQAVPAQLVTFFDSSDPVRFR